MAAILFVYTEFLRKSKFQKYSRDTVSKSSLRPSKWHLTIVMWKSASGDPPSDQAFSRLTRSCRIYAIRFFILQEILLDGELDPINLGGHVIMSRNATHKQVGPKLLFHYKSAVPGAMIRIPYFKVSQLSSLFMYQ